MQKTFKRALAVSLASVMAVSAFSITASAYNKDYKSETHTVFRHTEQTLAPGVEYYNNYAYLNDGEQVVYYAAVADINRDDVVVQGSYWNAQTEQYGMAKLTEQVASANAKFSNPDDPDFISENYTVVAGTNGDFYNMQTGRPSGAFAINGHIMNDANNRPWFAIFEDGTALCGKNNEDYNAAIADHGAVKNSVGGSQMLVKDGEDVTAEASGSYNTDRHSRTMIGVTADNKVVSVVVDGRQSPFSAGGSMHELAQIMIEAECVTAINLDGGGSTTFGARPEGEDTFRVINRPSDGSERSISSGVVIASLAAPSNVFDHVAMTVADEYVTPGTSTALTVSGVSTSGASAEIPAGVTYVSENGTVDNGVFTAGANTGATEIKAMLDGNVVGSVTVNVVIPDSVDFDQATFTVPYGKTMSLGITAKYGLNKVVTKPADFTYTLETAEGAGQIVNGEMVAPAEESGVAGNVVTATFNADNTKTTTANIAFGKASQVIFDFEDGTTQKWVRYNTNNYNYIRTRGTTANVTAANGQVHSGEHALKLEAKFSETWEAGYVSGRAGVYGMDKTIDLKGATRLGMWMYIPVANASFNGRIFMCKVTERDEETGEITKYDGYYTQTKVDKGGDWNCGFVTQYDEPGWHYIYFDLSSDTDWCIIPNHCLLDFYINDRNGDSYGYNHLNYTNGNADMNIYIDDVTVDYSSVVEDRERPVFSSVLLGDDGPHSNEGLALERGSNYTSEGYGRLDLSARVDDDKDKTNYTGINADSAKVYLDGVEFPCTYANGIMTAPTYTFTNGKHTVKFSIEDNAGNLATAIRTFTVTNTQKDQPVWIEAKDPTLDKILLGSLYWVNVKAANAASVTSIDVDLDLDNLSNWELDHMEVAQGFDASYEIINADENIACLIITRNGDAVALLDGDAIVSMPIRTWELPAVAADYGHAGVVWMYDKYKAGNEVWPVNVIVNVDSGKVTFTDNSIEIFKGDEVNVRTESIYWDNDNAKASDTYYTSWNGGHDHRAETAQYYGASATNHTKDGDVVVVEGFEPVEPTCTEPGFSGRYYCTVCNSISDWGHEIPAKGHSYDKVYKKSYFIISDNGSNQSPDLEFKGGVGYYVDNGEWKTFVTDSSTNVVTFTNNVNFTNPTIYCWIEGQDGAVAWPGTAMTKIGQNDYGQDQYTFEMPEITDYVVKCEDCNELLTGEFTDGKYYVDGVPANGVTNNRYYIDGVAQDVTGIIEIDGFYYEFDENGYTEGKYTGFIYDGKGYMYSAAGKLVKGWFMIDEDYYYFSTSTKYPPYGARGDKVLNGVTYHFESNGKLTSGVWVEDEKGKKYYYGPKYYYAHNSNATVRWAVIDGDTYGFDRDGYAYTGICVVHESNAPKSYPYEFTEEGVCLGKLTGIYNGCYYKDGVPCNAGVVEWKGDIYYSSTSGKLVGGTRYIYASRANGLLEPGEYTFDENGKLVAAEKKNGIVDGVYYVDDVPTYAGLLLIDGDYYYASNKGVLTTGTRYVYASHANGLLPAGEYTFGDDYKMIVSEKKNGIVDGVYYVDDVPTYAGLLLIDGDYYYASSKGVLATGTRYVYGSRANGLLPAGEYTFGDDYKMIR